ncbi:UNVERIFIED_CONTAM: hypothetical protein Slati_2938900 [Sesamum latifolium]|uniref:Uncharacterized protein n=1 Tax=Sesamum latifolium TaxID=2727402 RepID=A0AAW2VEE2_9LAMI
METISSTLRGSQSSAAGPLLSCREEGRQEAKVWMSGSLLGSNRIGPLQLIFQAKKQLDTSPGTSGNP